MNLNPPMRYMKYINVHNMNNQRIQLKYKHRRKVIPTMVDIILQFELCHYQLALGS